MIEVSASATASASASSSGYTLPWEDIVIEVVQNWPDIVELGKKIAGALLGDDGGR